MTSKGKFKKFIMLHVWRIQQGQGVLALLFVSFSLTGIFFPYIKPFFIDIGLVGPIVGLAVLFCIIFLLLFSLGLAYDTRLELWRPRNEVLMERNPYTTYKLLPWEVSVNRELWLPMTKALDDYFKSESSSRANDIITKWCVDGYVKEGER